MADDPPKDAPQPGLIERAKTAIGGLLYDPDRNNPDSPHFDFSGDESKKVPTQVLVDGKLQRTTPDEVSGLVGNTTEQTGPNANEARDYLTNVRINAGRTGALPPVYERMAKARAAGFSWDEINSNMAERRQKAYDAGFTTDEINAHLLGVPIDSNPTPVPGGTPPNLPADLSSGLRTFSDKWFGPHDPFKAQGLPTPGGDYTTGGLLARTGWTVLDFAKTFPGAIVNGASATAEIFDGKDKNPYEWAKLFWEAAGFWAMFLPLKKGAAPLPKPTEFLDAATTLAQKHPEGLTDATLAASQKALGEHFAQTGEHPMEAAATKQAHELQPYVGMSPEADARVRGAFAKLDADRTMAASKEASVAEGEGAKPTDDEPGIFHGSSEPNLKPSDMHYSTMNIYGQGFYTTDSRSIAEGYARKGSRRTGEQNVYNVTENRPLKMLDGEAPITPEIDAIMRKSNDGIVLDALEQEHVKNVRQLYDEIRAIGSSEGMSADDIQGTFESLTYNLKEAGYDGLTHLGGLRTNSPAHTVRIYFNPEKDISIAKASPRSTLAAAASDMAAEDRIVGPERVNDPQPVKETTFQKLMADESGSIKLAPRADIEPETLFQRDPEIASGIVHDVKSIFAPASLAPNASEAISYRLAQSAIETERSTGNLVRFGRAVGDLSTPERLRLIDAIETGKMEAYEGTTLGALAKQLRAELDHAYAKMAKLGINPGYVEDYLPHMWADPVGAGKWLRERSPLAGGKAFTKERVFGSYKEGIEAGLKPATDNPITMASVAIKQMNKYIAAHSVVADFRKAGVVQAVTKDIPAPADWTRITGRLGTAGEGDLYAPRDVARLINNITDPGLSNYSLYRGIRAFGNDMIQMSLAGPGYHASFVSLDAMTSQVALGVKQVSRTLMNKSTKAELQSRLGFTPLTEQLARGVGSVATAPISPVRNFIVGRQIVNHLIGKTEGTPEIRSLAEAFIQGGGRVGMTEDYRGSAYGNFLHAFKGTFVPSSGYATLGQEIAQTIRDAQPVKAWGVTVAPAVARAAYQLLGRTMDTIAAPLMSVYVPTMKVGTMAMLMKDAIRVAPEMGELEVRHVANLMNRSMDNRLGEMVYDNRFWNKTLKDVSHIAVRALGWNAGDIAEVPGGILDMARGRTQNLGGIRSITDRATYVVALPATTAMLSATMGVMLGTWNEDWSIKDYFFTPTPWGRISLPTYVKDIYNAATKPGDTAASKLNPMWPAMKEMLTNRDWYGGVITNPDDDLLTNVEDYAAWFGKQYMPIAVQQQLHPTADQAKIPAAARWLGVQPAPYAIRDPEKAAHYEQKDLHDAVKKRAKFRARQDANTE